MRISFYVVLLAAVFTSCHKKRHPGPLTDGTETLVEGSVYVVHSLIFADQDPWTTSNIYVLNGTGDTVWIYGSGYGDFADACGDCNDNNYYLGKKFHGTGPATADVRQVDSVIQQVFKKNKDSVILEFIVPHYHNDHINNEFIDAFYSSFSYPFRTDEKVWIHINDSIGALCDEPCCGTQPCPDKKNKYYGVPYLPHWNPKYKNMFIAIGRPDNVCDNVVKSFTTTCGVWHITKAMAVADGGHTDGTINLKNNALKIEIAGTKSKVQCPLPDDWRFVSVHGNISGKNDSPE